MVFPVTEESPLDRMCSSVLRSTVVDTFRDVFDDIIRFKWNDETTTELLGSSRRTTDDLWLIYRNMYAAMLQPQLSRLVGAW